MLAHGPPVALNFKRVIQYQPQEFELPRNQGTAMFIYFGPGLTENCLFQIVLGLGARRDVEAEEGIWRYHLEWSFGRRNSDDEAVRKGPQHLRSI